MEANQLRIGNLVEEAHSGEFGQVDMVVLSIIERMSNHSYKPIPLTEEWLTRFGFELCDGVWESEYEFVSLQYWDDKTFRHVSNRGCCVANIQYVHQLQNLYFALTGKELDHGR